LEFLKWKFRLKSFERRTGMKASGLLVCYIAVTAIPAFAGTYVYEFDFIHAGFFGQDVTVSYVTPNLTAPGTDLTSLVGGGLPPESNSNRDSSGAWNFFFWNSPTATASFSAETDLSFPNLPGFYSSLPATYSVQQMFAFRSGSTTVNISIQETPEPGGTSLALCGLVLIAGFVLFGRPRAECGLGTSGLPNAASGATTTATSVLA
jgi:hypothetical protein